jgi:hypothetical protein
MNFNRDRYGISIILILLLWGNLGAVAVKASPATDCPIETLTTEFKNLRLVRGHLSGGGEWNDDVDHWNGRKHQVMNLLGDCLGTGKYRKSDIIELMGKPDAIATKGDIYFSFIVNDTLRTRSLADTDEFLIYYWRGGHDFLYFVCQEENAVKSGWWFAGE